MSLRVSLNHTCVLLLLLASGGAKAEDAGDRREKDSSYNYTCRLHADEVGGAPTRATLNLNANRKQIEMKAGDTNWKVSAKRDYPYNADAGYPTFATFHVSVAPYIGIQLVSDMLPESGGHESAVRMMVPNQDYDSKTDRLIEEFKYTIYYCSLPPKWTQKTFDCSLKKHIPAYRNAPIPPNKASLSVSASRGEAALSETPSSGQGARWYGKLMNVGSTLDYYSDNGGYGAGTEITVPADLLPELGDSESGFVEASDLSGRAIYRCQNK